MNRPVFNVCMLTLAGDYASDIAAPYDLVIRGGLIVGRMDIQSW